MDRHVVVWRPRPRYAFSSTTRGCMSTSVWGKRPERAGAADAERGQAAALIAGLVFAAEG